MSPENNDLKDAAVRKRREGLIVSQCLPIALPDGNPGYPLVTRVLKDRHLIRFLRIVAEWNQDTSNRRFNRLHYGGYLETIVDYELMVDELVKGLQDHPDSRESFEVWSAIRADIERAPLAGLAKLN